MDLVFGFYGLYYLQLALPAAVLAAIFAYVRARAGGELDLATGASAYCALALAASAVLVAVGAGRLGTAALGAIDGDWTYGSEAAGFGGFPGTSLAADADGDTRVARDRGAGLGLVAAGLILGALHLGVRRRLVGSGQHDDSAALFVDGVIFVSAGLIAIALVAAALTSTTTRLAMESGGPSPGGTVAVAAGFAALACGYGYRVARALELVGTTTTPGEPNDEAQ